jgi:transcription initiation factor IIE alpha subunit
MNLPQVKGEEIRLSDEECLEQLELAIKFLPIPPYDKFMELICIAATRLKRFPEERGLHEKFDLYELGDSNFLKFLHEEVLSNTGDFISALRQIEERLIYLTSELLRKRPAIYKPPERVEKIQKALKTALKFLRDAIYVQCAEGNPKKVRYSCDCPQTTAWQSFVDFKNSFCSNDYTAVKQLRENTETQSALDNTDPKGKPIAGGQKKDKKSKRRTPDGEWSKPATKSRFMSVLGIDSIKTFNTFAKKHGIRQGGNRQTWLMRLDTHDKKTRDTLALL